MKKVVETEHTQDTDKADSFMESHNGRLPTKELIRFLEDLERKHSGKDVFLEFACNYDDIFIHSIYTKELESDDEYKKRVDKAEEEKRKIKGDLQIEVERLRLRAQEKIDFVNKKETINKNDLINVKIEVKNEQ